MGWEFCPRNTLGIGHSGVLFSNYLYFGAGFGLLTGGEVNNLWNLVSVPSSVLRVRRPNVPALLKGRRIDTKNDVATKQTTKTSTMIKKSGKAARSMVSVC